jgi:hypothetical protein
LKIENLDTRSKINDIDKKIEFQESQKALKERALERILDAFEQGGYSLSSSKKEKKKPSQKLQQLMIRSSCLELNKDTTA